jgi:hypothetical protein
MDVVIQVTDSPYSNKWKTPFAAADVLQRTCAVPCVLIPHQTTLMSQAAARASTLNQANPRQLWLSCTQVSMAQLLRPSGLLACSLLGAYHTTCPCINPHYHLVTPQSTKSPHSLAPKQHKLYAYAAGCETLPAASPLLDSVQTRMK